MCLFVSSVLQLTEIWGLIQTFVFALSFLVCGKKKRKRISVMYV